MKSPYVGTLVPNENVTAFFLVLSKEIRQKKTGEPYLSLHLADRTGEIEAKMWDNVAEVMHTFDRDAFVKVKGLVQPYQNRTQFVIHKLRKLEDHEVELEDFFPCSESDPDQMWEELRGIIAGLSNPHLQGLLNQIFADEQIAGRFKIAPAAKSIHHACRSGLLEHVLSLCRLCRLVGPLYTGIDLDLLLTGAILHDIGKIEELSYVRSFNYSPDGQLLGHIIIGLRIVGDNILRLPDFPKRLRTLLEHMIVSHHGELEFGSPKVPLFAEAMLLHHLDNLDSKMETIKQALKRDQANEGDFTGWVASLERTLLHKNRYLEERDAAEEPRVDPLPSVEQMPVEAAVRQAEPLPSEPLRPADPRPLEPRSSEPRSSEHPPRPNRLAANNVMAEKLQAVWGKRN